MTSALAEEDLATNGRNAWTKFTVAYETLRKNGSIFSEQLDAAAFRAEMQRFQLWAINLGLYRQDHSSLDYRLRDNEIVRSFTGELLTSLTDALQEITNIARHGGDGSPSTSPERPSSGLLRAEDEDSFSVSNGGGSPASPIVMGSFNDDNESMLTLHFEDVAEAINQLYNLASQIRSPKIRKYRTDIDIFKDVDVDIKSEYIKMRQAAESQGIEQMLLQSRKSLVESRTEEIELVLTEQDQYLVQRLQKANHARRQQFEYWRRAKKRSIRAASKAIEAMPVSISGYNRPKHGTPSLTQPSEVTPSLLSSAPALPKDFILEHKKSTYTGTSRGLTVHGPSGEKVNWPKPPVAGPKGEDFECPFCFYFCGPKYSEGAAWRSHLKHDLRPYVCTYDDCTEPNVLYDSWEEWTSHEKWSHQQRIWRCSEHPQQEHVELATYEDHVRTYHTASMNQLLSSELLKSQESVSQVCDRPCPFCQRQMERPSDLQQHIAGHLESIALLSLPNLDNIDETSEAGHANSNSANRNYAESRVGDFDRAEPLIFPENDHSEDDSVTTKTDRELFGLKLKAESISFDSMNEFNVEARQTYSSELAGGWLSQLPHSLDRVSDIRTLGSGAQTAHSTPGLNTVVESAQSFAKFLTKLRSCLRPLPLATDISTLMTELDSTTAALRALVEVIGPLPYHKRYAEISHDLQMVIDSVNYTFMDVRRLTVDSDRNAAMSGGRAQQAWEDMTSFFHEESGNSLRRRFEYFRLFVDDLLTTLVEGTPREQAAFDDLAGRIERLLDVQSDRWGGDPEALVSVRNVSAELIPSDTLEFKTRRQGPVNAPLPGIVNLGFAKEGLPHRTFSDQQETSSSNHWLPDLFNQSLRTTPLRNADPSSKCFGEHKSGTLAKLDALYVSLIEIPFERGNFIVRLYYRPEDGRSRFLCRTIRPTRSREECSIYLVSLVISRTGPFLYFSRLNQSSNEVSEVWARLKFPNYEGLVLFFCSFLALRAIDSVRPVETILDHRIEGEVLVFAGLITDDGYEHDLRLLYDKDTFVVRLQASVHTGVLRRMPVWTAFITDQICATRWASPTGEKVVSLASLQQFVFTDDYVPQITPTGGFRLSFVMSSDVWDFIKCLEEIQSFLETNTQQKV